MVVMELNLACKECILGTKCGAIPASFFGHPDKERNNCPDFVYIAITVIRKTVFVLDLFTSALATPALLQTPPDLPTPNS